MGSPVLKHLAVRLRCDEGEEELSRRARDLARTVLARQAPLALVGVFVLEPLEHRPHAVVEHAYGRAATWSRPRHISSVVPSPQRT